MIIIISIRVRYLANTAMLKNNSNHHENHALNVGLRLGNMLTDAMVDYFVTSAHNQQMSTWAPAAIAVLNGGDIRASVEKGTFYSLYYSISQSISFT